MLSFNTQGIYWTGTFINQSNMSPNCTNLDQSSHVGQTDSPPAPPDAASYLLRHRTFREHVQSCAIGHSKKVGSVANLKSKLKEDMSL